MLNKGQRSSWITLFFCSGPLFYKSSWLSCLDNYRYYVMENSSDKIESVLGDMSRYVNLSHEEKELIISKFEIRKLGKKQYLILEEQTGEDIYFVRSGCVCMYAINERGAKHVLQFGTSGCWITDLDYFEDGDNSLYRLQAIEDTELEILSKANYDELMDRIPLFERYFRQILEKKCAGSIQKIALLMCTSAEERFTRFCATFPDFVQKVPQYVLAEILGFTPQFLSMLRGKIKR